MNNPDWKRYGGSRDPPAAEEEAAVDAASGEGADKRGWQTMMIASVEVRIGAGISHGILACP